MSREDKRNDVTVNKFFKIMLPGFETQLNLPLNFCKTVAISKELASWGEIRSCLGRWKVRVRRRRTSVRVYIYGDGWNAFVKKHDIQHCDFLVFEHLGGSFQFHATIYDPSCCLKQFNTPAAAAVDDHHQTTATDNPTFTKTLGARSGCDYHKSTSCLYFPATTWKDNPDLLRKKKAILRISGLDTSREWPATLRSTANRFAIDQGWFDFVRDNHINKGHNCKFEIILDAAASALRGYSKDTVLIIVTT